MCLRPKSGMRKRSLLNGISQQAARPAGLRQGISRQTWDQASNRAISTNVQTVIARRRRSMSAGDLKKRKFLKQLATTRRWGLPTSNLEEKAKGKHKNAGLTAEARRPQRKTGKGLSTKNAARHSRNREFNHNERKDHKERRSDRKPRNTPATPKKATDIP